MSEDMRLRDSVGLGPRWQGGEGSRDATAAAAVGADADAATVTFGYLDSKEQRRKSMTLPGHEFLRGFLQHVPAKGFHRVRSFGLLHPQRRRELRGLQLLLAPRSAAPSTPPAAPKRPLVCPQCRKPTLRLVRRISAAECLARGRCHRRVTCDGARLADVERCGRRSGARAPVSDREQPPSIAGCWAATGQ